MTTFDIHSKYLEQLDSIQKGEALASIFTERDSLDGQEDTSIPAYAGAAAGVEFPLQLVASADLSDLYVRYGTVNGIVPSIGGVTPLSVDCTQNSLSFSTSGDTSFYLECIVSTTNGISSVDTVSIETNTTSDDAFYTARLLGTVSASGGELTFVSNALQGSQNVDSCGALHSWNLV